MPNFEKRKDFYVIMKFRIHAEAGSPSPDNWLTLFFFVFKTFLSYSAVAQVDSLQRLPLTHQAEAVRELYLTWAGNGDTDVVAKMKKLEAESRNRGAGQLARHFWSMQYQHKVLQYATNDTLRTQVAMTALEIAKNKGWPDMEAEWYIRTGITYYDTEKYGPAFEYMLRGNRLSKKLGYSRYPHLSGFLISIGLYHYYFSDYSAALLFFKDLIPQGETYVSPATYTNLLNTSGLCYQRLGRPDSALHYFTLANQYALSKLRDTAYAIIIDANKAVALRELNNTDEAIRLLEYDFQESPKHKHVGSAVHAAIELASIYLEKNDVQKARFYLDFAEKNIQEASPGFVRNYYFNMYRFYRKTGDFENALPYLDSAQALEKKLAKEKDQKIIIQAKHRAEVEQHLNEINRIETDNKKKLFIRNVSFVILLLVGLFVLVLYRRKLEVSRLHQQLAKNELAAAQETLNAFTATLIEKNTLIESIHQKLRMQQEKPESEDLNLLLSHSILTEEDWLQFRKLFEKVYPGFFFRLKEKFPDITSADIRLLSLAKLNLSTREMAIVLGISYESVKKSMQRLRHRIRFPEGANLKDVAQSI